MSITYLDATMAFFGFACIAVGSFADYLADCVLGETHSLARRPAREVGQKHEVRP
jgi:hypothetical protein